MFNPWIRIDRSSANKYINFKNHYLWLTGHQIWSWFNGSINVHVSSMSYFIAIVLHSKIGKNQNYMYDADNDKSLTKIRINESGLDTMAIFKKVIHFLVLLKEDPYKFILDKWRAFSIIPLCKEDLHLVTFLPIPLSLLILWPKMRRG